MFAILWGRSNISGEVPLRGLNEVITVGFRGCIPVVAELGP
ncbi:MAG: hypothetical protein NZ899_01455 [Thermoguttaceae bacterium]|nr:hypothetical protein [Thermoguttaceae bacterium]MDW8078600.1 hypothetical protein [Thermoguttaceae bacterium]